MDFLKQFELKCVCEGYEILMDCLNDCYFTPQTSIRFVKLMFFSLVASNRWDLKCICIKIGLFETIWNQMCTWGLYSTYGLLEWLLIYSPNFYSICYIDVFQSCGLQSARPKWYLYKNRTFWNNFNLNEYMRAIQYLWIVWMIVNLLPGIQLDLFRWLSPILRPQIGKT